MNVAHRRDRGVALEGPRRAPRRVLGYARVSSAEQALGTSLQDQQESIKAYATSLGLKVTRFYVEAESAVHEKIERREQIRTLMADAREGDLVVVDKLDRWSRDIVFTVQSIRDLKAIGASWFAVAERIHEGSEMMLEMRAVFAAEEHRRIRTRMVGTRLLLRDKGYYVEGLPPFGYRRRGGKGVEKNELLLVPEEAAVVRDVFARYIEGKSMLQIVDALGLKLYFVKRVLERRIYAGEIETLRGWVRGHVEPIIDIGAFMRARELAGQRRLGGPRPRNKPAQTDTWMLRDVARCLHCGARMSAAYAKRRHGGTDYYYRCAHRCEAVAPSVTNGSYIPIAEAHDAFAPMVLARLTEIRDELGAEPKAAPRAVIDVASKREKLAAKRARYLEAFADGHLSRVELRASMQRLDDEIARLEATAVERPRTAELRRSLLAKVDVLEEAWEGARGRIRREIVNRLAVEVRIARDESPTPRWRPLAELLGEILV